MGASQSDEIFESGVFVFKSEEERDADEVEDWAIPKEFKARLEAIPDTDIPNDTFFEKLWHVHNEVQRHLRPATNDEIRQAQANGKFAPGDQDDDRKKKAHEAAANAHKELGDQPTLEEVICAACKGKPGYFSKDVQWQLNDQAANTRKEFLPAFVSLEGRTEQYLMTLFDLEGQLLSNRKTCEPGIKSFDFILALMQPGCDKCVYIRNRIVSKLKVMDTHEHRMLTHLVNLLVTISEVSFHHGGYEALLPSVTDGLLYDLTRVYKIAGGFPLWSVDFLLRLFNLDDQDHCFDTVNIFKLAMLMFRVIRNNGHVISAANEFVQKNLSNCDADLLCARNLTYIRLKKTNPRNLQGSLSNLEMTASKLCDHQIPFKDCEECVQRKAWLCSHGVVNLICFQCKAGRSICVHDRARHRCKECGGAGICQHNRRRESCKECGGSSICQHNRRRVRCKECGGSSICQHNRLKQQCPECPQVKRSIDPKIYEVIPVKSTGGCKRRLIGGSPRFTNLCKHLRLRSKKFCDRYCSDEQEHESTSSSNENSVAGPSQKRRRKDSEVTSVGVYRPFSFSPYETAFLSTTCEAMNAPEESTSLHGQVPEGLCSHGTAWGQCRVDGCVADGKSKR